MCIVVCCVALLVLTTLWICLQTGPAELKVDVCCGKMSDKITLTVTSSNSVEFHIWSWATEWWSVAAAWREKPQMQTAVLVLLYTMTENWSLSLHPVLSMRHYAVAVLAVICVSVCLSQVSVLLRRLNLGLEIIPELFLVPFRPGTTSVRSGRGTFFVPEAEHAKHFLCS